MPALVVDRHLVYGAVIDDDRTAAFAWDGTWGADNVTPYSKGIVGVAIDVYHCDGSNIDASDFTFLSGSGGSYAVDESAQVDTVTTSDPIDMGDYSMRRITITFDDNEIANTWLQVTVNDDGDVGVADDHVFYFGSLVADVAGSSGPDLLVGSDDLDVVRNNWGRRQSGRS